jgi:hypothetical protein
MIRLAVSTSRVASFTRTVTQATWHNQTISKLAGFRRRSAAAEI